MSSAIEWLKMKMMSLAGKGCPDQGKCFETLEAYLDGEVSPKEADVVENRIKNCMPCYEHHKLDKAVKEVLVSQLKSPEVPMNLESTILDKLNKEE